MAFDIPEINESLCIPRKTNTDSKLKSILESETYEIIYSPKLAGLGSGYYDSIVKMPRGVRMTSMSEERSMQLNSVKVKNPRDMEIYKHLFYMNEGLFLHQLTRTGLRVPEGQNPSQYDIYDKNKYWTRILLDDDIEVCEVMVPEGNNRLVTEFNEVAGIPSETVDMNYDHAPYTTHFSFDPAPPIDNISDCYDVSLTLCSIWHLGSGKCFHIDASRDRLKNFPNNCFRPMIGKSGKINKNKLTEIAKYMILNPLIPK